MESVNKTRNDFTHRYFSSQISTDLENRIKDSIPKIMKTLKTLKEIHDEMHRE
jgi:hypothetical protein